MQSKVPEFLSPSETKVRASVLSEQFWVESRTQTSRNLASFFVAEWLLAIQLALIVSPRLQQHENLVQGSEIWFALIAGGAVAVPGSFWLLRRPGDIITTYVASLAQIMLAQILILTLHGSPGSGLIGLFSLVLLTYFRDARVIATATVMLFLGWFSATLLPLTPPSSWLNARFDTILFHGLFLLPLSALLGFHAEKSRKELGLLAEARAEKEEAARRCVQQTSEADASKARMAYLSRLSHEVRSPTTAILGYADLLIDPGIGPSERLNHVQTVRRNALQLITIIDDILDYSSIETGQIVLRTSPFSPSQLLAEIASQMRVKATEKGLRFELNFMPPIPESLALDAMRLRQVLLNLTENAIKYTDTGSVAVTVSIANLHHRAVQLVIDVRDTGIGMSVAQLEHLYQPFLSSHNLITQKYGRTGLGVLIAKKLTELMGGELIARSAVGCGSVFSVRLPLGSLSGVRMLENVQEAGFSDTPSPDISPASVRLHGNVLLAEDGIDNQLLISAYLRRAGANVTLVENGRMAVEKAMAALESGNAFDVVLMDMQMPELDGYCATSSLRTKGYEGPIIALTAHGMAGDRERCLAAGCSDYVAKPVERVRLITVIAAYMAAFDADQVGSGPTACPLRPAMARVQPASILDLPKTDQPMRETSGIGAVSANLPSCCVEVGPPAQSSAPWKMPSSAANLSAIQFSKSVTEFRTEKPCPSFNDLSFPITRGEDLFSALADDAEIIDLIELYVESLPDRITEFVQALSRDDRPTLQRLAHQMKGAAGGYGFAPISSAAGQLEAALKTSAPRDAIDVHLRRVLSLCSNARARRTPELRPPSVLKPPDLVAI